MAALGIVVKMYQKMKRSVLTMKKIICNNCRKRFNLEEGRINLIEDRIVQCPYCKVFTVIKEKYQKNH